ncbi:MAG: acyl carrier protein [Deltaproteobacteria bacterium HGW-Deltaproteobacteria-11]|nr:MAG: acyl carrier protein [Deltaproteobacteria bacterium HGW-Deltaproteobacteria-11]
MTRAEIEAKILEFFRKEFEIDNPGMDDDLREVHGFDSIDAIELLLEIENILDSELTQEEKKRAMDIRTLNQVLDYIVSLAEARQAGNGKSDGFVKSSAGKAHGDMTQSCPHPSEAYFGVRRNDEG